jgi:hypothetical protein
MADLYILNVSGVDLFVTGMEGDELSGYTENQRILNYRMTKIGTFTPKGHSWGWMDLGESEDRKDYQIYIESKGYFFFGKHSANRSQSDSNPAPFADGVSAIGEIQGGGWLYVLLQRPQ